VNAISSTFRETGRPLSGLAPLFAPATIVSLLFLAIITPPIRLPGDWPYLKVEQILLPLALAIFGWLAFTGYIRSLRVGAMFLLGAWFSISILLSIWYGSAILGHTVLARDFYEIPKVWFAVGFFFVAYQANLPESALKSVIKWFSVAMLLVCFYAWAQWFSISFSFDLNTYFSAGEHIDGALLHYRRVYSTMGNPNVLGQLLTWAIVTFVAAGVKRIGSRSLCISAALACAVTLLMTGSRYGLLTTAIALLLAFTIAIPPKRWRSTPLILPILFLLLLGWAANNIASTNQSTAERFRSLSDPLQTDSLRERLDSLWKIAESDFASSPFIGHGPAKTIYTGIITDSEYLDVLKEFGIAGLFPYLAFFFLPAYLIWKGLRRTVEFEAILDSRFPATSLTAHLALIMAVTALLMNIGESTFYNQVLQGFLWTWLGLGARAATLLAGTVNRIAAIEPQLHSLRQ
jgi:O-antigen ligase